eukprot:TRINITY_DN1935_c0_g1_i1.p1 TRINITY_DN1935_c0_g1~~TRINITY_DN1935_c0_g1_i1.p1  ORF type:complete len:121 (+),score=35.51 TRINITY_DN1935_c0_g1_i1:50-364(+)
MQQQITKAIADNPVMVFSKSYCPYCTAAKKLLKDLGVQATIWELDSMDNGAALQDAMAQNCGQRTVPQVFIKGEHIGGNSDTQALHQRGGLVAKLKAAGVSVNE